MDFVYFCKMESYFKTGSLYFVKMRTIYIVPLLTAIIMTSCHNAKTLPSETMPDVREESPEAPYANIDDFFVIQEIPDSIFTFMQGKSFKEDCIVPREDLRYLKMLHKNIDGETLMGEMVVNKAIAEDVLDIFRQLYEASYPIERIRLVDFYNAEDELSMRDNNSSSFNFRFISHTTRVSRHGLGLAVDINPYYNPYHKILADGSVSLEPAGTEAYLDRSASFPYKIEKGDLCWRLFTEKGFEWGGEWTSCKDWQHFEIPE